MTVASYAGWSRSEAPGIGGAGDGAADAGGTSFRTGMPRAGFSAPSSPRALPEKISSSSSSDGWLIARAQLGAGARSLTSRSTFQG